MAEKRSVLDAANYIKRINVDVRLMSDIVVVTRAIRENPALKDRIDFDTYFQDKSETAQKETFQNLSGYSQFMAGTGKGLMDTYRGLKQIGLQIGASTGMMDENAAMNYQKEVDDDLRLWDVVTKGSAAAGVGEFVGQAAATAPIPGGVGFGKAMAMGATAAGTQYVPEEGSRLANIALGAGAGAGGELVAKGARGFMGAMKGDVPDVVKIAEREGQPLSFGDVSRGPSIVQTEQYLEKVPIIGMGKYRKEGAETLTGVMGKKVDAAAEKVSQTEYKDLATIKLAASKGDKTAKEIINQMGEAGNDWNRIIQVSQSTKLWRSKKVADKLYTEVEKLAGNVPVPLTHTKRLLQEQIKELETSLLPDKDALPILQTLLTNIEKQERSLNFTNVRKARTTLRNAIDNLSTDKANSARILGEAKEALNMDLDAFASFGASEAKHAITKKGLIPTGPGKPSPLSKKIGTRAREKYEIDDAPKKIKSQLELAYEKYPVEERDRLYKAWKRADKFYKQQVIPKKSKDLANAMKNVDADEVYKTFIKKDKIDKAKRFYNALDPKGKAAVQYGLINNAMELAAEEGLEGLSPAKFAQYLEKMQGPRDVFFKGEDKWTMDGFVKLLKHAKRFGQYTGNPQTGYSLQTLLLGMTTLSAGAAGYGAAGQTGAMVGVGVLASSTAALKLLFTNKTTRNLLLKMHGAKTDGTRNKIMDQIQIYTSRAIAAQAEEVIE